MTRYSKFQKVNVCVLECWVLPENADPCQSLHSPCHFLCPSPRYRHFYPPHHPLNTNNHTQFSNVIHFPYNKLLCIFFLCHPGSLSEDILSIGPKRHLNSNGELVLCETVFHVSGNMSTWVNMSMKQLLGCFCSLDLSKCKDAYAPEFFIPSHPGRKLGLMCQHVHHQADRPSWK